MELDDFFGGELEFAAVGLALEVDAFVGDGAIFFVFSNHGEGLEPAGVGDDGFVPGGHGVDVAESLDGGGAGALHEMEGIHDEGLDACFLCVTRIKTADHAVGGVGKKDREAEFAVGEFDDFWHVFIIADK